MKKVVCLILSFVLGCSLMACNPKEDPFVNPGDNLGGGGIVDEKPSITESEEVNDAEDSIGDITSGENVPADAIRLDEDLIITQAGNYYVEGEISGKIEISTSDVSLYLVNAHLTNKKKVIESTADLTITLIGENSITNTNADGSNAIDIQGTLKINGEGSLDVVSTKNGIKALNILIKDAKINIISVNDGLHAEVDAYDKADVQPTPSYADGGYVYLDNAKLNITSDADGIQADTYFYAVGQNEVNIISNGGAPTTITTASSDAASGKGIKVGAIDWGVDGEDLKWDKYLIYIEDGKFIINANDDGIHSNSQVIIAGGIIEITSGDDGIHGDELLQITNGTITINNAYEGLEAAKIEISGGIISVTSSEDGINAADGTGSMPGHANSNCHIIISGGKVSVNCIGNEGDGIDSNGTMLISGGEVYVLSSKNNADSALDSDGGILVNGGIVFAAGSLGMVETPATNSNQNVVSFATKTAITAGTVIYLCDSNDNVLVEYTVLRNCQSIIMSAPGLVVGETYKIYGGNEELETFTISSTITSIGSTNVGGPGGRPGGGPRPGW